jgi:hypothetical protein
MPRRLVPQCRPMTLPATIPTKHSLKPNPGKPNPGLTLDFGRRPLRGGGPTPHWFWGGGR